MAVGAARVAGSPADYDASLRMGRAVVRARPARADPRGIGLRVRVAVLFESSGVVRRAFKARGHDAISVDLLPAADASPDHIVGDAFEVGERGGWDLVIAHPPCTYLCGAGLHWNGRRPGRQVLTDRALDDVRRLFALDVPRLAIENPVGCIGTKITPPTQSVQPFDFGEDASKRTCLWLRGLPALRPSSRVQGRRVEWPRGSGRIVERWSNQTDSGQNKLAPSADRWRLRSQTYEGIALAMAAQWGGPNV